MTVCSKEIEQVNYKEIDDYNEVLERLCKHVNRSIDDLIDLIDRDENSEADYSQYDIKLEFNGIAFNLNSGAAEYNGLLNFVSYVINQQ